ncbi:MAG: DUF3616 domain-containing protein [Fibrella sp.]|nr:DUF3616 domain-containing protein [Armatimonadota bacterium]
MLSRRFAFFIAAFFVATSLSCSTDGTSSVASNASFPGEPAASLVTFTGRCDGSAAATIAAGGFLVTASDETDEATEENTLAVYDPRKGGAAVTVLALNDVLGMPKKGKRRMKEADLEAATVLDGRIFWIASHSLSKEGEERTARYQFFATTDKQSLQISGKPYHRLKQDLIADRALSPFLQSAATRKPEESGGWNIEGMTATTDGRILIAFRNPVVDGNALIVPLLNPEAVVDGREAAKFGAAIKLDLSGGGAKAGAELGIRDIAWWGERKRYVILAGSYLPGETAKAASRLLLWDGKHVPVGVKPSVDLSGLSTPEAVYIQPGNGKQILILSDDGSVDGCKDKLDSGRSFKGAWVTIP